MRICSAARNAERSIRDVFRWTPIPTLRRRIDDHCSLCHDDALARRKHCDPSERVITMHIIWMLIIGLIVGALAKLAMPGKDPGGIIVTMLLGVAGSLIAGWLGRAAGWYHEGQSAGFIASFIGAFVLLGIYRLIIGRRGRTTTTLRP
jgi:uncharacterized membrane protein YeaQ/YmgE (transglycosylase-associated protein family)